MSLLALAQACPHFSSEPSGFQVVNWGLESVDLNVGPPFDTTTAEIAFACGLSFAQAVPIPTTSAGSGTAMRTPRGLPNVNPRSRLAHSVAEDGMGHT